MAKYIFLLVSLLLLAQPYAEGLPEYKIEHVSLEQGVSNNMIFCIYQDSKGFIWFGTMFGLIRYDGIEYKTFRNDPANPNSISNDDVVSVFEDKDGFLWIGTYFGGLNKYDRTTGNFSRFLHDPQNPNSIGSNTVWKITQDKEGLLWFGTDGAGLCKFDGSMFTSYKFDSTNSKSIGNNTIFSLLVDSRGTLWAGTAGGGLNKFNKSTNEFTRFKRGKENSGVNSISGNAIRSLYEDVNGTIWIGTITRGLNKFDESTCMFTCYLNNSPDTTDAMQSNSIFSINASLNNKNSELWISTGNGFYSFDQNDNSFTRFMLYTEEISGKENIVTSLKDNSGVIWLSTYFDGLHKFRTNSDKFNTVIYDPTLMNGLSSPNVRCFYEDKKHNIWIGTSNGLNKFNKVEGSFENYFHKKNDPNSLSSNSINDIAGDSEGNLWIATDLGLNKFNPELKTFKVFLKDPALPNSLSNSNVTKILIDSHGDLWVGTALGLNKYINDELGFLIYKKDPADSKSLSENTILTIYEDKGGELWFATYAGLNKLDPDGKTFTRYQKSLQDSSSLGNNYVFSFCEDNAGNFWIGTGGGLEKFDKTRATFTHIGERDGLPNPVICGILNDGKGALWISTKKGLTRFSPVDNSFKNFSSEDGLQSNMFIEGSCIRTSDGRMFFGGINGFSFFDPSTIKFSSYIAPVIFTDLTKYNESRKTEMDISGAGEIELAYSDNVISIGFASLDYTNPAENEYAYMLEGFDKDWVYSGNNANALYTNLDPGKYTLKVKATNSDGVWNETGASLSLIIKPPFWKTWWFYGFVMIFLVATVMTVHNYRVKRKVLNLLTIENAKEEERERMREQAARDYHDELGHKLTRISIYSRRIRKKLGASANGITSDLVGIADTSNSLQSGARDLIWSMDPKEDSLYDFAVRLKDFGNEIFEGTETQFKMTGISESFRNTRLSMYNKRHLIFIFKEAMNNALKYSNSTSVTIDINLRGNILEMTMQDNGIGFDLNNDVKGYGIKNIYNRARQISARVEIVSEANKGTTIKFTVGV